jgi:hypothetical protein
MTRAASLLLRVLGLTLVLVGFMGFVLLGADGTWTARTDVPAGRTAVLLEPAVVSVLGTNVTVRIEPSVGDDQAQAVAGVAPPAGYFVGRGRADDLTAYAQGPAVSRVVGLTRSRELEVRDGPAGSMPAAVGVPAGTQGRVAPAALDLWQQEVSGPRARQLSWRPTPGARSVLVAREDGSPLPALGVEVAWTNHTWLWMPTAALVLGLLLIVAGLVLGDALPSPARLTRPTGRGTRTGAAAGKAEPVAEVAAAGAPSTTAETASVVPEPAPAVADPSPTVVAPTRRAARGRRRKRTVWDQVRSRTRLVASVGRAARAKVRAGRGRDSDVGREGGGS